MIFRRYLAVIVAVTAFGCIEASAQYVDADLGYTPYSIFGIGEMSRPGTTYNLSMGGIGIGDRNNLFINTVNPAAITARDPKAFMMDFGLSNQNTMYLQGDKKSAHNVFNMRDIVATMPIGSKGAFKMSIMPYSTISYDFISSETNEDILSQIGNIGFSNYGRGSVYQVVLGGAVNLFNRLSIGVDGQYYFGNLDRHTDAGFTTSSHYKSIEAGWNYLVSSFNAKFGLQYTQPLGHRHSAVLGLTYSLGTNMNGVRTRYVYGASASKVDTICNEVGPMNKYRIPSEIGVGITFREREKWMVGFDYTLQDWSRTEFEKTPGVDFKAVKSQSFRAGFEYTPNKYDIRYYVKRMTFRGGFYHEKSYMCLDGNQINATGLTLGVTFPISPIYHNSINLGVDLGERGSLKGNMVKERYVMINVSFSLHDVWFLKQFYN